MSFIDFALGKPLATSEERAEQIGPIAGIPVFGLDALSSAAYGPEAALTLLIPLGAAGIGAVATGLTLLVVLVAKFADGAWITVIIVPALIVTMKAIKRHYDRVECAVIIDRPVNIANLTEPLVIVPLDRWSRITEKGLRFAMRLSDQIQAVHVDTEDGCDAVRANWERNVAGPLRQAGHLVPDLVFLPSPYRYVLPPLVDYVLKVEHEHPERQLAVLIPELMVKHWWEAPLHNQRAQLLKLLLLVRGNQRIIVINTPWYI